MRATDHVLSADPNAYETISFPAADGLEVTADVYGARNPRAWLLLCHQAFCNRGEYRPIAPRLAGLGYASVAIDQRSGMTIFGVRNETSARAKAQGRKTGYVDARVDVEAGLRRTVELARGRPVVLVGSSYSASLALLLGATTAERVVAGVAAFSPGEHLKKIELAQVLRALERDVFVTSARKELAATTKLMRFVDAARIHRFRPRVEGLHGARSLWTTTPGHEGYWTALEGYLASVVSRR